MAGDFPRFVSDLRRCSLLLDDPEIVMIYNGHCNPLQIAHHITSHHIRLDFRRGVSVNHRSMSSANGYDQTPAQRTATHYVQSPHSIGIHAHLLEPQFSTKIILKYPPHPAFKMVATQSPRQPKKIENAIKSILSCICIQDVRESTHSSLHQATDT